MAYTGLSDGEALGLHLTAGASDGYLLDADSIYAYNGGSLAKLVSSLGLDEINYLYIQHLYVDPDYAYTDDLSTLCDIGDNTRLTETLNEMAGYIIDLQATVDNLGDISDSGTVTYTAGDGIDISNYTVSIDDSQFGADMYFSSGRSIGVVTLLGETYDVWVPNASSTDKGIVQTGTGLVANSGVLNIDLEEGSGIDIDGATIRWDPSSVDVTGDYGMLTYLDFRSKFDVADTYHPGTGSLNIGDIRWHNNALKYQGDDEDFPCFDDSKYTSICVPYAGVESNNFGVVKAGDGITITDGVVSIDTDDFYCDNYFSTGLNLATVYLGGTDEAIYNTIYAPYATTSQYGVIKVGTGLDVSSGVLSVDASDVVSASSSITDGVKIGSITIDSTTTTFYMDDCLTYDAFVRGYGSNYYASGDEVAVALGDLIAGLITIADSNWDNLSSSQQTSIEDTWGDAYLSRFLGMLEILFNNAFA